MAYRNRWTDDRIDNIIGNLLRAGVLLAAVVVLAGGIGYLFCCGARAFSPSAFSGQGTELRTVAAVLHGVRALDSLAVVQLGLILLVATPIARVLFALIGFSLQGDHVYTVVSFIVLAVLIASFTGGFAAL